MLRSQGVPCRVVTGYREAILYPVGYDDAGAAQS